MTREITIYGLFVNRRCVYVGRTANLRNRMKAHYRWFSRKCNWWPFPTVLRRVPEAEAKAAELQMIAFYDKKGEADFNIAGKAAK